MNENKNIEVGGRLHSIATGNVLAGADEILDDTTGKKQSEINIETYRLVENINESLENLSPEQTEALSVATKANNNEIKLGYFECSTDGNVASKTITDAAGYVLSKGGSIKIKMINANTTSNVTLNINSTGAKTLYYNNELASPTNTWENNEIIEVYYDGNNYYSNNVSSSGRFSTGEKVKNVGIDDEPTIGSENLVKSGGIYDITNKKLNKNTNGVAYISDDSEGFHIADNHGNVVVSVDASGIHSPNINNSEEDIVTLQQKCIQLKENIDNKLDKDVDGVVIIKDNSNTFAVVDNVGRVAFRINADGKTEYANGTSNTKIEYKNNLKNQNVITPIIGGYGEKNAVYKVEILNSTSKVAFDFLLSDNLNTIGTDKAICTIVGNQTKDIKTIHAVPTDLNVSRNGETYTAVSQMIGYNSGFNVCGTSYIRRPDTKNPIVGKTVFAMWLKGNFTEEEDFPSAENISTRATWLSEHSSAQIEFINDVFSVTGIENTAISINIKEGQTYKSLGVFYDEVVTALGNYFDFRKFDLSAEKTTKDLLQFGTLKLVSNYWQQTNKTSTACSYNYDSFPVSIPLAVDESLHTVEIVNANGNVYVSVDGEFVKYSDTVKTIYIGGTSTVNGGLTCFNLEVEDGTIGDAMLSDVYGIVSEKSPRVIGVMQHLIEDKYEGESLTQRYHSSVSRMIDTFKMIENRGYTILSLNDICLWLSGRKKIPARSIFFLATTNPTYDKFLNDLISRRIWTSLSVPLIIGSIINTDVISVGGTDNMFKQVVSARAIGVDYITHLYDHDVMPDYKNSLILQQELYKLIRLCIASGIDTRMYSYGWSCESVNYYNMLSLNGFIGAMGGGEYSTNARIKYNLARKQICDSLSLNNLSNILI